MRLRYWRSCDTTGLPCMYRQASFGMEANKPTIASGSPSISLFCKSTVDAAAHARSSSRLSSVLSLQLLACKVCSSTSRATFRRCDTLLLETFSVLSETGSDGGMPVTMFCCANRHRSSTHALRPSRSSNPLPSRNSDLSPVYASRFWIRSKPWKCKYSLSFSSGVPYPPFSLQCVFSHLAVISCAIAPSPDGTHDTDAPLGDARRVVRVRRSRGRRRSAFVFVLPVNGVPISRPLARVDLFSRAQQRAPAPRLAGLAATRTLAMPFGFSMGEVVVTLGVVAVAFGPKDIPVIARGRRAHGGPSRRCVRLSRAAFARPP